MFIVFIIVTELEYVKRKYVIKIKFYRRDSKR